VVNHFYGFKNAFTELFKQPLGQGLGSTGNFGEESSIGESYFGALITQLGLLGLLTYMTPLIYFLSKLYSLSKKHQWTFNTYTTASIFSLWIATWLSALFNETAIALVSSAFIFFLLGASTKSINQIKSHTNHSNH
jgi:hypothetical protein